MPKPSLNRRGGASKAKAEEVIVHGYNLTDMAKRGEVPPITEVDRLPIKEKGKLFEEIDKVYPELSGVWGRYYIKETGRGLNIVFTSQGENALTNGISTQVNLSSFNPSAAERSGAIKYAVYQKRPALEYSIIGRIGGYPNLDMSEKWGGLQGRLLTNQEKAAANKEMYSIVEKALGFPISEAGKVLNENYWKKEPGGWRRAL